MKRVWCTTKTDRTQREILISSWRLEHSSIHGTNRQKPAKIYKNLTLRFFIYSYLNGEGFQLNPLRKDYMKSGTQINNGQGGWVKNKLSLHEQLRLKDFCCYWSKNVLVNTVYQQGI